MNVRCVKLVNVIDSKEDVKVKRMFCETKIHKYIFALNECKKNIC